MIPPNNLKNSTLEFCVITVFFILSSLGKIYFRYMKNQSAYIYSDEPIADIEGHAPYRVSRLAWHPSGRFLGTCW